MIDTLVEQVQNVPGENRAVVMLGYEEEMRRMFKNCNPGLARRFQMENAFVFPDYNDIELLNILQHKAKAAGLRMDFDVAKRAVRSLSGARAKPHFGNAGAVENMLSGAKLKLQARGTAARKRVANVWPVLGRNTRRDRRNLTSFQVCAQAARRRCY